MAGLLTIVFIIIATALPLAMFWSAGSFVGQRPPPWWAMMLIRYSISACLFIVCAVAALLAFRAYHADWWATPMSALIAGAGLSGILAVNSYKGD